MKENKKIIIAVAWPYANGDLHVGHPAGYLLPASVMNEYFRVRGRDVVMISGSDMHGTPVAVRAMKEGLKPYEYAKKQHQRHAETMQQIGLNYSLYTTTATTTHAKVVQWLFTKLEGKGYITKADSENFWSEKEHKFLLDRYIEGTCPHCGFTKARGDQCDNCGKTLTPDELIDPVSIFGDKELKKRKSTNYYLDLAKIQPLLEKHYEGKVNFTNWRNHVRSTTKAWIDEGLEPRAITRDMDGYGVQLPLGYEIEGQEGKVIYVWFEAVTGYLSAVVEKSLREKGEDFESGEFGITASDIVAEDDVLESAINGQSFVWQEYWNSEDSNSYYFMGKDNIPFHAVIWTAMLLGLNDGAESGNKFVLPTNIFANQYLNLSGGKFSKSTGNVIDTREFWEKYGDTSARYYLISRLPENKDYDFTWEEFVSATNNELIANLANFINRTLTFYSKNIEAFQNSDSKENISNEVAEKIQRSSDKVKEHIELGEFSDGMKEIMELASFGNKYFNDSEIWAVIKTDVNKAAKIQKDLLGIIIALRLLLTPYLPKLSAEIAEMLGLDELDLAVGEDNWKVGIEKAKNSIEFMSVTKEVKPLIRKLVMPDGDTQTSSNLVAELVE